MADYVNDQPTIRRRNTEKRQRSERSLGLVLLFSFGLLCVIQAALNISLRLFFYKSQTPCYCNITSVGTNKPKVTAGFDKKPRHCNELQERFNALTADRNLLENRISELNNEIKRLEEDKKRLSVQLGDSGGCALFQRCPDGWREIHSKCYFLSSERMSWSDSLLDCWRRRADLVVIDSEEEQRALYRLDGNQYLLFWIGLKADNGTFTWVDGSKLTKTFWQVGEPSRSPRGREENCVEMYHDSPVLQSWNNAPCRAPRPWMCERALCGST